MDYYVSVSKSVVTQQAKSADETKKHTFFSTNLTAEIQQAVQISVVTVGAVTVTTGEYGYGAIIACTILLGKALLPFCPVIASIVIKIKSDSFGYKSLDSLMKKQPTEHAKGNEFMRRDRYEGEIKFDNVNYSYPNQDSNAIENISFKIAKGERVGLVGRGLVLGKQLLVN